MESLQALGVSGPAETLYLDLLQNPGSTPDALMARYGDIEACLAELTALGLVERADGSLVVRPPRLAMDAVSRRTEGTAVKPSPVERERWTLL